jgi:hypothetical protein
LLISRKNFGIIEIASIIASIAIKPPDTVLLLPSRVGLTQESFPFD